MLVKFLSGLILFFLSLSLKRQKISWIYLFLTLIHSFSIYSFLKRQTLVRFQVPDSFFLPASYHQIVEFLSFLALILFFLHLFSPKKSKMLVCFLGTYLNPLVSFIRLVLKKAKVSLIFYLPFSFCSSLNTKCQFYFLGTYLDPPLSSICSVLKKAKVSLILYLPFPFFHC